MTGKYFEGVGRRKTTVARVRIFASKDTTFVINEQALDAFFPHEIEQGDLVAPFKAVNLAGKYSISAKISGGGRNGWKDAIILGIARALVNMDEELKSPLRKAGFLTRDARAVERKKAGLKKARKAPRFSKR
ncbi:MAG: 30S ribosomal protein S9 [Candidatus Dojkabacteria bacterium]|nr:MAG: 30S ribosomal protein S9 [Candidatus Dojkabacteria bacterium]